MIVVEYLNNMFISLLELELICHYFPNSVVFLHFVIMMMNLNFGNVDELWTLIGLLFQFCYFHLLKALGFFALILICLHLLEYSFHLLLF